MLKSKYIWILLIIIYSFSNCTSPIKLKGRFSLSYRNIKNQKKINYSKDNIIHIYLHRGNSENVAVSKWKSGKFTFTNNKNKNIINAKTIKIKQEGTYCSSTGRFYFRQNTYKGCLKVIKTKVNNKTLFTYIAISTFEDYLISVIGHEMSPQWPIEALKAQSILARTYALNKITTNTHHTYDIVSSTQAQVYSGIPTNKVHKLKRIVQSTTGQILSYKKKLAQVFYHASSGGRTASAEEVWGNKIPYLQSKVISLETKEKAFPWERKISLSTLSKALNIQNIKRVKIVTRTNSKRAKEIRFYTSQGENVFSAKRIRQLIGSKIIPSTLFKIESIDNNNIILHGLGYGHGVGLSQWGAKYMAEKNYSYQKILSIFFPKTRIKNVNSLKKLSKK